MDNYVGMYTNPNIVPFALNKNIFDKDIVTQIETKQNRLTLNAKQKWH